MTAPDQERKAMEAADLAWEGATPCPKHPEGNPHCVACYQSYRAAACHAYHAALTPAPTPEPGWREIKGHWPAEAFPVGDTVEMEMEARGWDRDEVARRMGGDFLKSRLNLDFILDVREEPDMVLGLDTARQLEAAFGISALFWNRTDELYRVWLWLSRQRTRVRRSAPTTPREPSENDAG